MGPQRGELGLQGRALGSFDTELMLTVLDHSPRLRRVPVGLGKLCLQVLGPLTQSLVGFVALTTQPREGTPSPHGGAQDHTVSTERENEADARTLAALQLWSVEVADQQASRDITGN